MIVGIDIGGSHITAALIKEDIVKVVPGSLVRYHVQSQGIAGEILDIWAKTIKEIWVANDLAHTQIGIAMPGPFDYEEGISLIHGTEKYEALYEMNVRKPLALRLGINPELIRFRNDAASFLLGEMMGGAGIGFEDAIGITLGTGLGSSVHHNKITNDAARWSDPLFDGIAEDYISTRFFTKRYQQLSGAEIKDVRELAARVETDEIATWVFQEFSKNLALFLKQFIKDEQPQVVIIGGNIANAWDLFYPDLTRHLREELKTVEIKKAVLGEEAALIGGACCWL